MENIHKFNYIKIKNFHPSRHHKENERQAINWGKLFAAYTTGSPVKNVSKRHDQAFLRSVI